ncbi:peptidylprolyl isomerase [Fulvivirga sediminis]|uniref:Peptidylprolyl isomerase n=1 Tax=Fulvivirga sediminis TaxID=2803949 RepID=A0A937JZW1_9BACT|nr:peptidylprolyl isomerase [Fulvivirga sediminis]MBL3654852.1 peptidylprolyl isomerase [Fulvivirga sediminis]
MKNLLYVLTLFALVAACQVSKNSTQTTSNQKNLLLFTVADDSTYTDEFIYVYKKNNINNDSAFSHADISDYLKLYQNFKLKIKEAKSRGMDTTDAFHKEYDTYKEQLKKPYLSENKVTDQLIKEAYDRYKQDINASHILIMVGENASPEDTLKAYNKIIDIRQKAIDGADFGKLAKEYSEDPSAQNNGGNLGYFTSMQMVYPFESAAYNTPEGEISKPVRTKFGYHIIKVINKRPSHGRVEVSHIMIRIDQDKADSLEARNKIFEIYDQANGGVNWDELAQEFSEDINTKNTGGKLPIFGLGKFPFAFQEAAFALQTPGQISDPVMSPYGWHIIKLEKKLPIESFQEMEPTIQNRISRDSRAQISKKLFITKLKKENEFSEYPFADKLSTFADSTLTKGKWTAPKDVEVLNNRIFSIKEKTYTAKDFFTHVAKNQTPNSYAPKDYMEQMYNNYIDQKLLAYEEEHLEDKYLDYRMLVKEYKEGILLFQLMEEEVWNKAVKDSTGLKSYYEKNLDKYQAGKRVEATIYNAKSQDIIDEIKNSLKNNTTLDKAELEREYNQKGALSLQIKQDVFEQEEEEVIDQVEWTEGIQEKELNGRFNLIVIKKVLPPGPKALDQIKGMVISDYQNYLEKQWVDQLREKYPVKVNEKGRKYIYEQLEKK